MNIAEPGGTDLGRRIVEHRHRAGLSREEAASRAGMAPSYLRYLETSYSPNPSPSAVARLEDVLGLSAGTLAGAGLDVPPGRGSPPRHAAPRPAPLTDAQCRGYLGTSGVGRFIFAGPRGPEAIPVNYAMLGDDVVIRTGRFTNLAGRAALSPVSFEVDHLDDVLAEGWSVLVRGDAHVVSTPAELELVRSLDIEPWAGGDRDTYVRLAVSEMTGRRIRTVAPEHGAGA
ncbi:MAG TPA: pyridoxamine 5'-phosphate oxidase family protein [Streptosporangiaceae bacterium]|nr:pyridoxamine 5'-phosphate oxidase family protein [Streptosporangiaceae bacterium]